MNRPFPLVRIVEVTMNRMSSHRTRQDRRQRGQILVILALGMVAFIGGVAVVIESGNAYAHQRVTQNATDSVANAGATTLAQRLGGGTQTDADVLAAMDAMAAANTLDSYAAWYTNVTGSLLNAAGATVVDLASAAQVGSGAIPPGTQGVRAGGNQTFGTTFARVLGFTQFTTSADATAITGAITGGEFLPVVFPVSMALCDGSGDTVVDLDAPWRMSDPNPDPNLPPVGQEYIVPLCKTTEGGFQVLDLDPTKDCAEEARNPTSIYFAQFPIDILLDEGNDCAKKIQQVVATEGIQGTVVMIPICDGACVTMDSGHRKSYHIIRIASFYVDYMADKNGGNDPACEYATSPTYGTDLDNIVGGNGSSSCLVGWFVRYVTNGPVGTGQINNGEALGVQLIR